MAYYLAPSAAALWLPDALQTQLYLVQHRGCLSNLRGFWNLTTGDSLILGDFLKRRQTNRHKKSGNSTNSCLSLSNPVTTDVNMKRCKHGNKHFFFFTAGAKIQARTLLCSDTGPVMVSSLKISPERGNTSLQNGHSAFGLQEQIKMFDSV